MSRIYWMLRAVICGRVYYADGSPSERVNRSWAWACYRPYPRIWLEDQARRRFPGLLTQQPCGCTFWTWGRQTAYCSDHFLEELETRP